MAGDRQNFMETKPVDRPGSMTVFFCLSLLLIGAMICTCLESARTAGLRFMSKTASDSALQSVFADYHEQLWEDYHVFFHYGYLRFLFVNSTGDILIDRRIHRV